MNDAISAIASHEGTPVTEDTDVDELLQGKDTPSASPAVKEEDEKDTPSQEGEEGEATPDNTPAEDNVPFHKNPRFQQIIQERNQARERAQLLEEELAKKSGNNPDNIPQWFATRVGDDPEAWAEYLETTQAEKVQLKKEILAEIKAEAETQANEEAERINELETYIEASLDELGLTDKSERNELTKFMIERPIYNQNNQLDFKTAKELLDVNKLANKEKSGLRKLLAGSTLASDGQKTPGYATPETVGRSWYGITK